MKYMLTRWKQQKDLNVCWQFPHLQSFDSFTDAMLLLFVAQQLSGTSLDCFQRNKMKQYRTCDGEASRRTMADCVPEHPPPLLTQGCFLIWELKNVMQSHHFTHELNLKSLCPSKSVSSSFNLCYYVPSSSRRWQRFKTHFLYEAIKKTFV